MYHTHEKKDFTRYKSVTELAIMLSKMVFREILVLIEYLFIATGLGFLPFPVMMIIFIIFIFLPFSMICLVVCCLEGRSHEEQETSKKKV